MTEAYELLKSIHFHDVHYSVQAYIKKRLFNSDVEAKHIRSRVHCEKKCQRGGRAKNCHNLS